MMFESPERLERVSDIEDLARLLNDAIEDTDVSGGVAIGALTMLLAVWLDRAPDDVANEIRERVVSVLKGKIDG